MINSSAAPTIASSSSKRSWRDVVRNFSPAWFAVNTGTGVISSLFHDFPYRGNSKIMNVFALAFFLLNILLFSAFFALSVACYIMFPHTWRSILHHPVQSFYLSYFPMGAATLITVGTTVVSQYWGFGGTTFVYILWAFWWLDAILSCLCCFGLIYVTATRHHHSMATFTPLWLLPVITLIVCSTTGQLLAETLISIHLPHAFLTMGVSIVMVVIGGCLALMILTVYISRILIDGFPDIDVIISSFIPLGACSQAGYSLLLLGQNLKATMPSGAGSVTGDELSGRILSACCFFTSFSLWSLGIWWLFMAFIVIADMLLRGYRIPFNLAFWGLVFPNGVQALLTMHLAVALDATMFRVLGSIYGASVILTWFVLAIPTFRQVLDGSIFFAPYLDGDSNQLKGEIGDISGGDTR